MNSTELYSFLTYELDDYTESDIMYINNNILECWDNGYLKDGSDVAELMSEIYENGLVYEKIIESFFIDGLIDVIFGN